MMHQFSESLDVMLVYPFAKPTCGFVLTMFYYKIADQVGKLSVSTEGEYFPGVPITREYSLERVSSSRWTKCVVTTEYPVTEVCRSHLS